MNWKPLIFWGLGFGIAALAGLISSESAWNTPLLLVATILIVIGTIFELGSSPKNPGYRLYQSSKYLSVKDFCEEVITIHRGNTRVLVRVQTNGMLLVSELKSTSNTIATDGEKENELITDAGTLRVVRYKEGFKVCWTKGTWALY